MSWQRCIALFCVLVSITCQTVPITHRRQLHLVPSSQLNAMAATTYEQFLDSAKVIKGTPESEMVKRVGERIACAVDSYFTRNKLSDRLKGYHWEFNLIQDSAINAWAMPGGRVAVYTGILPVARNDTGLAVAMAHEISHAIANHGDERLSQGLIAQLGGIALAEALRTRPELTQQLFLAAYGVGAQVGVLLPYSRLQESEADHLGLIFMSVAGYDPCAAVDFWRRMMQAQKGAAPPEFLSTHPSDQNRLKDIQKLIPQAMKYYRTGICGGQR